jgi:transposase
MERYWKLATPKVTVGIDLGDRMSDCCVIDKDGLVIDEFQVATTQRSWERSFAELEPARIVLEAGTHSPWTSRLLESWGHEVIVANPTELYGTKRGRRRKKRNDKIDAEYLARVGRVDPWLLYPIRHRGEEAQAELALIQARDALVGARSKLVNHVRGLVKSSGGRLPRCSTESFARQVRDHVPESLREVVAPVLDTIADLTQRIRGYDKQIEHRAQAYPETVRFQQIQGVGPVTSLCYRLVVENPHRFKSSRSVGSYLGLCPKLDESGGSGTGPEKSITKAGDVLLRRLLVNAAHYILGPFGPDTDLRRWGLELASRGGKNAKKRAVVAVARKLAVLLHRLWISGEDYEPLRNSTRRDAAALSTAA